jgi:hypothetical protein
MERFISTMRRLVEALREADTFSTAEVEAMINARTAVADDAALANYEDMIVTGRLVQTDDQRSTSRRLLGQRRFWRLLPHRVCHDRKDPSLFLRDDLRLHASWDV